MTWTQHRCPSCSQTYVREHAQLNPHRCAADVATTAQTKPSIDDARDYQHRLGDVMATLAVIVSYLGDEPCVALALERACSELALQTALNGVIFANASTLTADLPPDGTRDLPASVRPRTEAQRHAEIAAAFDRPFPAVFPPRAFAESQASPERFDVIAADRCGSFAESCHTGFDAALACARRYADSWAGCAVRVYNSERCDDTHDGLTEEQREAVDDAIMSARRPTSIVATIAAAGLATCNDE